VTAERGTGSGPKQGTSFGAEWQVLSVREAVHAAVLGHQPAVAQPAVDGSPVYFGGEQLLARDPLVLLVGDCLDQDVDRGVQIEANEPIVEQSDHARPGGPVFRGLRASRLGDRD
jgi:hypothetical protein